MSWILMSVWTSSTEKDEALRRALQLWKEAAKVPAFARNSEVGPRRAVGALSSGALGEGLQRAVRSRRDGRSVATTSAPGGKTVSHHVLSSCRLPSESVVSSWSVEAPALVLASTQSSCCVAARAGGGPKVRTHGAYMQHSASTRGVAGQLRLQAQQRHKGTGRS